MQLEIDGLSVAVRRKNIKHMHLYVKPPDGRVEVSAPLRLSDERIAAFVREKAGWIQKHQSRIAGRPLPNGRQFAPGETLLIWGRPFVLRVERGDAFSFRLDGGTAVLTVCGTDTAERRKACYEAWLRARLRAEIEKRLPQWESRTGLFCTSWQIRRMTSRWGTCNTATRKIWLSLMLAERPPQCLDYILLHELAHLQAANHGPDFTAILDRYMPDWREIRSLLA